VDGATSNAQATVIKIETSGAQDQLIMTKHDGTPFQAGEDLKVGAPVEGTADAVERTDAATTAALHAEYKNLAADSYSTDILAVPGSGPVRGVWMHNDVIYAVRNNTGGSFGVLHKATVTGWDGVDNGTAEVLGVELEFSSGGADLARGSIQINTASGTSEITWVTVNGVNINANPIVFSTDIDDMITALVADINLAVTTPNYIAFVDPSSSDTCLIFAVTLGTFANGYVVGSTLAGSPLPTVTHVDLADGQDTTAIISEGDIIENRDSPTKAQLTVTRVSLESGSWASGTAAGHLIASTLAQGAFANLDLLDIQGGLTNVATADGAKADIKLPAGGRYEFINHNFGGQGNTIRVYGVNDVGLGFEFDGTVFAPIRTGMTTDQPNHVAAFENHLFFSFLGSAQHSGIGAPFTFSPIFGASELAVGEDITGFKVEPGSSGGGALGIYSRNRAHVLYGTDSTTWQLENYREEIGAIEHSLQQMGVSIFFDDRGVTSLRTTQRYGNFVHSVFSRLVQPTIEAKRNIVNASCVNRNKNQYRVFFSDDSALYCTFEGDQVVAIMRQQFAHTVECIFSLEQLDGTERTIFGSDDGFVYELDKGTSHAGVPIEAYLIFHYHHFGLLRVIKKYHDVMLEAGGNTYAEFSLSYELGYNAEGIVQPAPQTKALDFKSWNWDSFVWDEFFWDGITLSPSFLKIPGEAENIALVIRSNSDEFGSFLLSGALFNYTTRRRIR
jgi:hypothetical protein